MGVSEYKGLRYSNTNKLRREWARVLRYDIRKIADSLSDAVDHQVRFFADSTERAAAVPTKLGEVALQVDTRRLYIGTSLVAGAWSSDVSVGVADEADHATSADSAVTATILQNGNVWPSMVHRSRGLVSFYKFNEPDATNGVMDYGPLGANGVYGGALNNPPRIFDRPGVFFNNPATYFTGGNGNGINVPTVAGNTFSTGSFSIWVNYPTGLAPTGGDPIVTQFGHAGVGLQWTGGGLTITNAGGTGPLAISGYDLFVGSPGTELEFAL